MIDRRLISTGSTRGALGAVALGAIALAGCASGEAPGASAAARASTAAPLAALAQPLSLDGDSGVIDAGVAGSGRVDAGGASDAEAGPRNDCCSTSPSGGCNDAAVAACVCEGDPFCCSTEYDALCVTQAISRCSRDCDDRPPESDCCSPSDGPGCSDAPVAACICEIDPFCCVFRFDPSCVNLGVSRCNLVCGEAEVAP